jgi:two-component system, sensor histidine kinase PdtaS
MNTIGPAPHPENPDANRSGDDETTPLNDAIFRRFTDSVPTLNWMADAKGNVFWFNRRWHEYCGTTLEEMEGWGWQSVHDPASLSKVLKIWQQSISTGEPFEITFPLRGADGIFRPFLTRGLPDLNADGSVAHWFGVSTEVTAQVEVEAQLRAANTKLAANEAERDAMLQQLSDGVIIADPTGRITFINEAATRLHGVAKLDVTPEEYPAAYNLMTVSGDPHPAETLPLTRAVRNREVVLNAYWRIRRPDGTEVLAIGNAQPFYDAAGNALGGVLTIQDDTSRFEAEKALAYALNAKEALLLEVNHRVKNSLQMVTSLLAIQASKSESNDLKQALMEASTRISVFADLHSQLYNTGLHDRVEITTYLKEIAQKIVRALDPKDRITLFFESPDKAFLKVDHAVPLALMITELLTNAVKHAFDNRSDGEIHMLIAQNSDELEICVSDNGAGLSQDFDIQTGSSMGMRIISALVEQVRGKLEILKRQKGAAFLISLPSSLIVDKATDLPK